MEESNLFSDEPRLITEILKKEWGDELDALSIAYLPEQFMTDARVGHVYVYQTSHSSNVSTTDYRTVNQTSYITIRVSNRFRDVHLAWLKEIYRILMLYRRAGTHRLNWYTHLEISIGRTSNDASGWYVTTVDVKLNHPHMPLMSPGFGNPPI